MTEILKRQKEEQKLAPPSKYNVVISNDDFTTFEFVIDILMNIFGKNEQEAMIITQDIHKKGKGVVGPYTLEIAESKKMQADYFARKEEHPLKLDIAQL